MRIGSGSDASGSQDGLDNSWRSQWEKWREQGLINVLEEQVCTNDGDTTCWDASTSSSLRPVTGEGAGTRGREGERCRWALLRPSFIDWKCT